MFSTVADFSNKRIANTTYACTSFHMMDDGCRRKTDSMSESRTRKGNLTANKPWRSFCLCGRFVCAVLYRMQFAWAWACRHASLLVALSPATAISIANPSHSLFIPHVIIVFTQSERNHHHHHHNKKYTPPLWSSVVKRVILYIGTSFLRQASCY